jgi:hypothetical protein
MDILSQLLMKEGNIKINVIKIGYLHVNQIERTVGIRACDDHYGALVLTPGTFSNR